MAFDRNDPADLQALQDEVNNDPTGRGYAAVIESTGELLELLNEKQPGVITVSKPKISTADVRSATPFQPYNNMAQDRQEYLRWITGSNGFNEENMTVTPDLRQQLAGDGGNSIWQAADEAQMEPIMLALIDVPGSRAEELFGYGTVISNQDWFAARDYTG